MLYFAYGSNLNLEAMMRRCPAAVPLTSFDLANSSLVFRGVADCVYDPGARCPGGIWRITPACERALDRYEGIGSGYYRKEMVPLTEEFYGEREIMLYVMNSTGVFPPSQGYLATLEQGYKDFRLPLSYLRKAVRASWDDKHPTHHERQRYRRHGRPPLAPPPKPPGRKPKAATTGKPTTGNLFGDSQESV